MKAAVDIGTNTIRMLIGKVEKGKVKVHAQFIAEPRLGVGISKGRLTAEAVARTVHALEQFKKVIEDHQIQEISIVATSAVRDATNKKEFIDAVLKKTGWQVEIITGAEEALLSYTGAVSALPVDIGLPVVVDIGGGSTEVIFQKEGQIKAASVNVGAVRFGEAAWSQAELKKHLLPALREVLSLKEKIVLVAVGGTATTAAAILFGIKSYCREAVQGKRITLEDLTRLRNQLAGMTLEERKKITGLTPKRADIIVPGLEILISVLIKLGEYQFLVSDAGILDGLLLRELTK